MQGKGIRHYGKVANYLKYTHVGERKRGSVATEDRARSIKVHQKGIPKGGHGHIVSSSKLAISKIREGAQCQHGKGPSRLEPMNP